ncbi:MAG: phosphate acyltransferase PlsX [Gemmatimonadetes bacterium]|nr:phosphate acyltransferase PlsX [Gemmatimonadota bacterium]
MGRVARADRAPVGRRKVRYGGTQAKDIQEQETEAPQSLPGACHRAAAVPTVRQSAPTAPRLSRVRLLRRTKSRRGQGTRGVKIALDAMGGDFGPDVPVVGALEALAELPESCEILLVGRSRDLAAAVAKNGGQHPRLKVVDAPEVVEMGDKPLAAIRSKPNSSIAVGLNLHKKGEADAFISAGNTGAVMAASTLLLRLHPGVDRPAIGALFPTMNTPVLVLDSGANVDCSARELAGFAQIGAVYARDVLGRPDPTVGLLNIGEEPEKGSSAAKEAHQLLIHSTNFRFIGNVEGRDILTGECDVVVCDGFVGNVLLKFYESVARLCQELLRKEVQAAALQDPGIQRVFRTLDYSEYGGAPLLGVKGVSIICHGRSSSRAIKNAIRLAVQSVQSHLSQHIGAEFAGADRAAV